MQEEKKYFGNPQNGGGDFDSAFFSVGPNNWVNAENIRTLTTDAGEVNTVESLGANVLKSNSYLQTGTNIYIGNAIDEPNNRIIFFCWNSTQLGGIFSYDVTTETWYVVLYESQVKDEFTWDKNKLIHSARVINGCVYWTDDLNMPRRVDIDAGIKLNHPSYVTDKLPYTAPLSQAVISWIRRQPGQPPYQEKVYQTIPAVDSNQIAAGAWTFSYRYVYRNFEISTLSAQSTLANYNADGELFNRINIVIPSAEHIDQDVIQIDLCARYLNSETVFIIHSWRSIISSDAAAIAAHNAGGSGSALTYAFYNDVTGIALDTAYSLKLFDNLPIRCRTIEMAKNRSFMGDYVIGYDTPLTTSLALSVQQKTFPAGGGGPITGEWFLLKVFTAGGSLSAGVHTFYLIQTTVAVGAQPPAPTYIYQYSGVVPPYPASVNDVDLTFLGSTPQNAIDAINPGGINAVVSYIDQGAASVVISGATPTSKVVGTAFKSDAAYQVSISFKDRFGQECGVLTNPSLIFNTPDTGLSIYNYVIAVNWALNNANALNEIPIWAWYYSINITKCLRTRFFLQSLGTIIYADKDTSGNYTFTTTAYDSDLAGVAIDVTFLTTHAQGYLFSEGDVVRLFVNGSIYTMSIIAQVDQFIIGQLTDVGALSAVTGRFEIYTPFSRSTNEPYFEIGQIFPIQDMGTSIRTYSTLVGSIFGDVYLFSRTNSTQDYITEAMNINDKYYKSWFTNAGRPNFIDYIGQTIKTSSIAFSNTFIPGSQNNGLSTYDALDTKDVYPECGSIQKLQLTSKVEGEVGTIMLAVCTKETASLYLSEQQLLTTGGNAFVAQATGVIGTINVLKGSFGTLHPESVVEFRGNVYFLSVLNGKYIQYSANGLFPISSYKMTKFWKLFCEQLMSMTTAEIEALGSRPFVFSCVDPHNWEVLVSIPRLLVNPPKGYLPDYPDMVYPFDIWDGKAKTVVYKLNAQPNHWSGSYPFSPEGTLSIQNKVFSFKNAQIYEHNTQIFPATYYGVAVKARIMFTANQIPNRPKVFNNISIEGNLRPSLTYFRTEPGFQEFEQYDLEEQASDLLDFNFEIKEGNLYAAIYRNKIQPTAMGFNLDGLLTGNKMRAVSLLVLVEFDPQKGPLELRFLTLGYQVSAGHTT